jgi:hypothetical protein
MDASAGDTLQKCSIKYFFEAAKAATLEVFWQHHEQFPG